MKQKKNLDYKSDQNLKEIYDIFEIENFFYIKQIYCQNSIFLIKEKIQFFKKNNIIIIMGSSITICNDTSVPVTIWFQLLGGGPPAGGYHECVLNRGERDKHKFTLSLVVQLCVKY